MQPGNQVLAALAFISAAAWLALLAMQGDAEFTWELLKTLCLDGAGAEWSMLPDMVAMWVLMCFAMMLPVAAPVVALYAKLIGKERRGGSLAMMVACFIGGYLLVWCLASIGGAVAQTALADASLDVSPDASPDNALIGAGAFLTLAGVYQFSPLKQACLSLCRNPMNFFFRYWREGPVGAVSMGLAHGAVCFGCCWALMALMLIAGAMNPLWMAALGAVMLIEKLAPGGAMASRALGAAAVLAGTGAVAAAAL
jgi:predicted metal-binding membrane protein